MNKLLKTKMHSWLNKRFIITFSAFVLGLVAFNAYMKKNSKPTPRQSRMRSLIMNIMIVTMIFMVVFPETFLKYSISLI